jgi:hypothetical protein
MGQWDGKEILMEFSEMCQKEMSKKAIRGMVTFYRRPQPLVSTTPRMEENEESFPHT